MAISPNGKLVALFTADSRLWVVSTDFQTSMADCQTSSMSPPLQIAWCGNDSVVLHWEDTILVIGPSGIYLRFAYEGIVSLCAEIDCVRIVSQEKYEILQKVEKHNEEIFKIGSTAPSAILYDARDHFVKKNAKADECIRSIKMFLPQAVESCINAAANEFHPDLQKQLLKSASFGKAFLDNFPASKFVDISRAIRILNSIRTPAIAMPLTIDQYLYLGPDQVVLRLANRHHYGLAKKICEFLKISTERVLIMWACYQVFSVNSRRKNPHWTRIHFLG